MLTAFTIISVILLILIVTIFLLGAPELERALKLKEHENSLLRPKLCLKRHSVLAYSKKLNSLEDLLKCTPSNHVCLVHLRQDTSNADMYILNSYDALLQASQVYVDYCKRDCFKIYS